MKERQYSFQTGQRNSFGVTDIVIFVATLSFSAGIGVFYAIKDRKKKNVKDFLMAGGNMHLIPVAMSLLATFMSAITLLGTPAEMYNFTTIYLWIALGYLFSIFLAVNVYLPVFYNLRLTSIYEYLEKRFSRGVRTLGTSIFSLQMVIYMAIVLYGPSLALNAVTGLSLWGSVAAVGIVCTFYTTLGGMKAVLWADTFQVVMMIAGMLAALIQGCIELGGFYKAWDIADQSGRIQFWDFRPYPNIRHGFWSLTIGGGLLWTSVYGANQAQVQRALTCGNLRDAKIALWLNVPGLWIILLLCSLVGIVMYAFYSTCDPLQFGLVFASDQLFPLFVMDVLGHIPGVPGLFVASIFSGSLSTMSSGLNSLAAVVLQDILKPYCLQGMSESRATLWSRVLAVIFGIVCLGLTWVASKLGGILQAALSLFGMLGCPMLGLFTLGMLFPCANTWGAYAGLLSSLAVMFWVGIGSHIAQIPPKLSPRSTGGCNWTLVNGLQHTAGAVGSNWTTGVSTIDLSTFSTTSSSLMNATLAPGTESNSSGIGSIYELSYLWYSVLAVFVVLSVGLLVSVITGGQDPKELDPRLVQPLCSIICPFCPKSCLRYLHCGVRHDMREEWQEREEEEKLQNDNGNVTRLEPIVKLEVFDKDSILYEAETVKLRPVNH